MPLGPNDPKSTEKSSKPSQSAPQTSTDKGDELLMKLFLDPKAKPLPMVNEPELDKPKK